MPSLGPAEILVILVVALLVFGPNKMPEIGRQVARGVREFRRVQQHLSSELHSVVSDLDPTAPASAAEPRRRPASDAPAQGARGRRHRPRWHRPADATRRARPSPSTSTDPRPAPRGEPRPSPPAEPA